MRISATGEEAAQAPMPVLAQVWSPATALALLPGSCVCTAVPVDLGDGEARDRRLEDSLIAGYHFALKLPGRLHHLPRGLSPAQRRARSRTEQIARCGGDIERLLAARLVEC